MEIFLRLPTLLNANSTQITSLRNLKRFLEQLILEDLRRSASVSKFSLKVSAKGNYHRNINCLSPHRWKFINNTIWKMVIFIILLPKKVAQQQTGEQ